MVADGLGRPDDREAPPAVAAGLPFLLGRHPVGRQLAQAAVDAQRAFPAVLGSELGVFGQAQDVRVRVDQHGGSVLGRCAQAPIRLEHPAQPGVGLAQDLGFVHGEQFAAAHQHAPVDDGGVDGAAVGREDQVGVELVGVAVGQRGEHDVAGVDQDHIRLGSRGQLPGLVPERRGPVPGGHPQHVRGLEQAGVDPGGPVDQRGELHHLEQVAVVGGFRGVVAEPDVDPRGQHLRDPGDAVAQLGVAGRAVGRYAYRSPASGRSRCRTARRSGRRRSPGRAGRRRTRLRWAAARTVPCCSPPRSATRSGARGCRCPGRRPGPGRRGATRGRPAAATRSRPGPRSGPSPEPCTAS